jgi:hypothetical protein
LFDILGLLQNWDAHRIAFQNDCGGYSVPRAKNLVLEIAYYLAYHVEALFQMLCLHVNKCILNPKDLSHEPEALSVICSFPAFFQYDSIQEYDLERR